MPVLATDLLFIQRGSVAHKTTAQEAKAYFDTTLGIASATVLGGIKVGQNLKIDPATGVCSAEIEGALTYKGAVDLSRTPAAEGVIAPVKGDLYVNTHNGTVEASWPGIGGKPCKPGQQLIYNGTDWDLIDAATAGVEEITGSEPVVISGTATKPDVSVRFAVPSTGGVGGNAGVLTAQQLETLLNAAAGSGVVSVSGVAPIVVTGTDRPQVSIVPAGIGQAGAVELATNAETSPAVAVPSGVLAVSPAGLKANYMPLDISVLTPLP